VKIIFSALIASTLMPGFAHAMELPGKQSSHFSPSHNRNKPQPDKPKPVTPLPAIPCALCQTIVNPEESQTVTLTLPDQERAFVMHAACAGAVRAAQEEQENEPEPIATPVQEAFEPEEALLYFGGFYAELPNGELELENGGINCITQ
jgi:hypothetical protein